MPALVEKLFQVVDGVSAEVEDTGRQRRVGLALGQDFEKVFGLAGAAARDHGNARRPGNSRRQFAVEAVLHTISIHRRQQNLSGA
jgi:hypothetical protein